MNDANALHPSTSAWDARPKRDRKGFTIAVTAMGAAHGLLIAYLYKSTFDPHYAPLADQPPVIVNVVPPNVPPPAPPSPSAHPKVATPPMHPHVAASPPIDVKPPEPLLLPSTDKSPVSDPQPQSEPSSQSRGDNPRSLTNPQFNRKPNADDMAQYYPERANRLGEQGAATIRCTVSAKGALIGCIVETEDPPGFGFGEAALKLAKVFRLKPATADGVPVDGGVFSTRIIFKLPD